ncbi:MAG: hypothetical protein HY898_22755 [Deltaproteobacteria bacterium]|nr:hypothetical protein [Deltaproteobacteria bacterium]
MRIRPSWLILLGALSGLAACTVKSADEADAGAGGGGLGGAGGTGATAGTGGSAGTVQNGACGDIPVSGKCDGNTLKMCMVADDKTAAEKVVSTDCGANRKCVDPSGKESAKCQLLGECSAGDTSCKNDSTLLTCQGTGASAKWAESTCNAANGEKCIFGNPGKTPSKCVVVSSSGTPTKLKGKIQFERRPVKSDNSGWGDPEAIDAVDVYVGVFNGNDFIGKALTGYDPDTQTFLGDGSFTAELTADITAETELWVWAMAFNYETGNPLMALAHAKGPDMMSNAQTADEYWAFGGVDGSKVQANLDTTTMTMKPFVITEGMGSGALNVFQWIDFGLQRTQGLGPQKSLIVYWNDKDVPQCGACFCGTQCGGGVVKYGTGESDVDNYDTWIALGGPDGDQTQWAKSVISHEFGHYVMHNNSLSPGEGGQHFVGQASKPGLAYSEAWATSFGQSNVSTPIYVDQQEGTVFWVDISKYTYSNGNLQKPDPAGPIDQNINENVAAGMIWKLWAYQSCPNGTCPNDESITIEDPDGQGIGSANIFKTLTYPALVNGTLNRGYSKVDLVDFLDAAVCSGAATDAQITAVCDTTGYPYKSADRPACP